MLTVPIIDISPLLEGTPEGSARVAASIGAACRGIGFFYITGHGVNPALVAEVFAASAAFFALPVDVKRLVAIDQTNRGYVSLGAESLDPTSTSDNKEAFNIGVDHPPSDPRVASQQPFFGANQWPDRPVGFRRIMLQYFDALLTVSRHIHRAFCIDLGVSPATFFDAALVEPLAFLRLLQYPATGGTAGAHTDYGNVTLLAQDTVGGLEVLTRTDKLNWVPAPVVPGSFVCNIGDCLMRWTNDVYVSSPHRVRSVPGAVRRSVAFFCDLNGSTPVVCLPTCRREGEANPRYAPTTVAAYLTERLDRTYAHRKAKI